MPEERSSQLVVWPAYICPARYFMLHSSALVLKAPVVMFIQEERSAWSSWAVLSSIVIRFRRSAILSSTEALAFL